jgi:flagellar basal-body rod protein FlgB
LASEGLFRGTIPLLGQALDLRSTRHNLIASNIANMDTPHHKALDLMVEEELVKVTDRRNTMEIQRTHAGHLSGSGVPGGGSAGLKAMPSQPFQSVEGNTVDIDRSMADLSENSLKFNATAQIISNKFKALKTVIQGGGR